MDRKSICQQIIARVEQMYSLALRRGWTITRQPIIEAVSSNEEVDLIEKSLDIQLPDDFRFLLTECSRHIDFSYQFDMDLPNEFNGLFGGDISWNLEGFNELYSHYQGWVDAWLGSTDDILEYQQQKTLMENKVPLMHIPNGDLIVIGYSPSEVIYFSHEGDELHGKRLGNNLFEFLEYYIQVGFTGNED